MMKTRQIIILIILILIEISRTSMQSYIYNNTQFKNKTFYLYLWKVCTDKTFSLLYSLLQSKSKQTYLG